MVRSFLSAITLFFCLTWQPQAWGQLSWPSHAPSVSAPTMGNISGGLSHAGGVVSSGYQHTASMTSSAYQHQSQMASSASQHTVSVAKQTVQHPPTLPKTTTFSGSAQRLGTVAPGNLSTLGDRLNSGGGQASNYIHHESGSASVGGVFSTVADNFKQAAHDVPQKANQLSQEFEQDMKHPGQTKSIPVPQLPNVPLPNIPVRPPSKVPDNWQPNKIKLPHGDGWGGGPGSGRGNGGGNSDSGGSGAAGNRSTGSQPASPTTSPGKPAQTVDIDTSGNPVVVDNSQTSAGSAQTPVSSPQSPNTDPNHIGVSEYSLAGQMTSNTSTAAMRSSDLARTVQRSTTSLQRAGQDPRRPIGPSN